MIRPSRRPADVSPTEPAEPTAGTGPLDAVVVGAGPAGAVTALCLARSGYDVALLDREPAPRPKACGDCLSAGATDLLRRLGVLDRVRAAGPAAIEGWDIISPGGGVASGSFGGRSALAMDRATLDGLLVAAARGAGARFVIGHVHDLVRDGSTASVRGVRGRHPDGRPFRLSARLVVGADGLRSVVSRRLGLVRRRPRLRKVSLTTHARLPSATASRGEMHVLAGGCVGFAPVGDGWFNITVVVDRARAGSLGRLGAPAFFLQWVRRAPGLRDRIGEVRPGTLMASGPFDWPVRSAAAAGAALVGDAAGYYDPFTGQGIYHAMAGAMLLADTAGPHLRSPRLPHALRTYARAHRRMVRPALVLQRVIEAVLSRPALADRALDRLGRAPAVIDGLVAVTGDLRPATSLLSPALLSTLVRPPLPGYP